jgi:hypothetical protein
VTDNYQPRRGRPPSERRGELQEATEENPVPAAKRTRGPKIGVLALKLQAPERPGFTRRFASAHPDRIAELERLGYSIVTDPSIPTTGLGSGTVQRPAGIGESGDRYNHILMETPDELYAQGVAEGEQHRRSFEGEIRAGRDPQGRLSPDEQRDGQGSIKVDR